MLNYRLNLGETAPNLVPPRMLAPQLGCLRQPPNPLTVARNANNLRLAAAAAMNIVNGGQTLGAVRW